MFHQNVSSPPSPRRAMARLYIASPASLSLSILAKEGTDWAYYWVVAPVGFTTF
ncbi:hypothetical protein MC7420_4358 [Coleofasciculus chthonoplastes PCC 7420]|uniref:Uncharacterized protein n=1 Tax=Coleofasciculus chthonoplastes PCC 7420 TaxID=118168 RepID=B4VXY2_9CYAN|nr:hypothetical protein MC7420_4358 [Coleofasciculus chthonoplastes PCC 7420]